MPDRDLAARSGRGGGFYARLFGCESEPAAHWRIDFWVDDVDATAALATDLGGRGVVAPHDIGIARQAVLADPDGAEFSVSKVLAAG